MPSRKLRNLFSDLKRISIFAKDFGNNKKKMHDNWSFGFRDIPFGKTEKIVANALKFCEIAFMVIKFPIVFLQTLHETSDRYIKLKTTDTLQIITT